MVSCPKNCQISQSPTRRTLLVTTFPHDYYDGHSSNTILDASSSPPRVVRICPQTGGEITDRFAYGTESYGTEYNALRSPLCEPKQKEELPINPQGGSLRPLNDGLFLLLGMGSIRGGDLVAPQRGIEVVTSDGQIKFRQEMPKHDIVTENVRINESGDRFAVIVDTWRGGSSLLDISGKRVARRVVVYTEKGQQLATVPLNPVEHRDFDFSLSPDGHRLAILDEDTVTVVDLE